MVAMEWAVVVVAVEWTMEWNGQWTMVAMDNGQWTMEWNGQWLQWTMDNGCSGSGCSGGCSGGSGCNYLNYRQQK